MHPRTIVALLLIRTAAVVHLRAHTHPSASQFTSLFGARLSEKMEVALHSPWLRLPRMLSILADRGFRNCQRFYARYNRCVFTCLYLFACIAFIHACRRLMNDGLLRVK